MLDKTEEVFTNDSKPVKNSKDSQLKKSTVRKVIKKDIDIKNLDIENSNRSNNLKVDNDASIGVKKVRQKKEFKLVETSSLEIKNTSSDTKISENEVIKSGILVDTKKMLETAKKNSNIKKFTPKNSSTTVVSLDEDLEVTEVNDKDKEVKDTIIKFTSLKELEELSLADLRKIAKDLNIKSPADYQKKDLILNILEEQTKKGGNIFAEGYLEIIKDTHGVLRSGTMLPGENDVYVSSSQIKRFNLRKGDFIAGQARPPKEGERYLGMLRIEAINNESPHRAITRPSFNSLTPIFPEEQIKLETEQHKISTRLIDLVSPIGKGQRAMIVAPPKAGKTWLLKDIADGIVKNHPDIHLMVVLVGERPEEVTDMQRFVKGEVIAANFDESPEIQTRIAEMAVERGKRLVEYGKDVVILMDSITRLARSYNLTTPPSGRTLSGGFDPLAIYPPKKFFGAARNMENGGSLTIVATALVDTGSKMDDVIFEEFKGTGNMEVVLDRRLAGMRIFPAIEVTESYTRNEDKLLEPEVLAQVWRVVRMLDTIKNETKDNPTNVLIERLKKTKNNEEFLQTLHEAI